MDAADVWGATTTYVEVGMLSNDTNPNDSHGALNKEQNQINDLMCSI